MANDIITIPSKITKGEELIVIPRSLYEQFLVKQGEVKKVNRKRDIDEIIATGERELKEKRTIVANSSKEALKMFYGKKNQ